MKYIDEFRNARLIKRFSDAIKNIAGRETINIMEVCGTHTHNFYRFGLDKILPSNLRLISGPGCPVCVSDQRYIDAAIKLAEDKDNLVLSFGDMLPVPGSISTLEKERAHFGNVRVVYSAQDSLRIARLNPQKKVIFLAVGFETTAPTVALSILAAKKQRLKNLYFLSSLKLIPPAMRHLVGDKRLKIDAFLCPGHVSAVIGMEPYKFIVRDYQKTCCIAGFEPLDIIEGIYLILRQLRSKKPALMNQYRRAVPEKGNPLAKRFISRAFDTVDACWRGLGEIPQSGLKIKNGFSKFDAQKQLSLRYELRITNYELRKCRCGDVLKGLISPLACSLFGRACQPDNPVGPCMVTSEGACNAYYKYQRRQA